MALAISAVSLLSKPCPRAGITITGLGTSFPSVVTLWRLADGERHPVRGARRALMSDSDYIVDYDVPLGRNVQYEAEVITGPVGAKRAKTANLVVTSSTGWLMDPLVPSTAVAVSDSEGKDAPHLRASALDSLEYHAATSIIEIMGQDTPMGLFGPRMKARGVPLNMATESAAQNRRLKTLLLSGAHLLYRPNPAMSELELPGTMFLSVADVKEIPVNVHWKGYLTQWELTGDTVAAPAIKVLTATFTYGDVQTLTTTYQQKQNRMAGKTYLEDMKNPLS